MSDSKSFQGGAPIFTLDNEEAGSCMFRALRQFIAGLLVKDSTSPSISLQSRSLSPSVVAPSSSESSSSGGDVTDGVTFVGNTTSTVLFFLALAVGVLIAVLFVFFTFRYFIRSKYGLHVYPIPHRTLFYSSSVPLDQNSLTNVELQEQINYVRDNNYIRGEILARRINRGRNRRRRRGGRYSRMKKLTEQEVEILFPKKTYYDWLNGGQERDHEIRDGVLQEESMLACTTRVKQQGQDDTFDLNDAQDENLNRTISQSIASDAIDVNQSPITKVEGIEMQNMKLDEIPHATHVSSPSEETDDELHFTSGTCAICLEILENDDNVRGLICGHVFHSDCLDPWLTKRRACCPMCKRDYFFKDEHNNSLSQQGNSSSSPNGDGNDNNTNNNQNNDADDDYDDIDFDAFRNDPALTALLQELVPLQERVRTILNDTSLAHLNIEQRATEIASKKRGNALKVVWWKIMGISKEDLFNWAVITIHRQERQNAARDTQTTDDADSNANDNSLNTDENVIHTSNSNNPSVSNDGNAIPNGIRATNESPSVNDITNANTGTCPTGSNNTPYTSNSRPHSETDISRDIVEQRV
mmetsp:Transcript_5576/g.6569  ORF Transcript_5576/g.6569 Transcript_5576/m.6569 type:complete len:584 (+) Transcript_5576:200-1951(+)